MPDKEIEEFFLQQFLKHYTSVVGKQYIEDCRPEEREDVAGNYDFLCKDEGLKGVDLAVEEKTLRKSKENVRDSKEIREMIDEVNKILDEKHLPYNGRKYIFYLDFKNAPKINERARYVQKIVESAEQAINENKDTGICKESSFDIQGYDCIKRFCLSGAYKDKNPKSIFPFHTESNFSWDLSRDTLKALLQIIDYGNSQLKIPREEGKKTALLIIIYWPLVDDKQEIRNAMKCIHPTNHEHIDEIFSLSRRGFEDEYDIHKIK
jgi:hypothetical protein